ncbi:MAG: lytic murein transglycosylase B [Gammaproteobacteria bacterium]|nr:MAG: lytic murein transglycosylase B [Gammaproteobacteria bacterium]
MTRTFEYRSPTITASLLAALTLLLSASTFALDAGRADVASFIDRLVTEHGFERDFVVAALATGETKQKILDAISRPAEKTKPWYEYREIFVTPKRINAGVEFWHLHRERLERVSSETGVPAEILCAIVGVETYYGRRTGTYRVLDALATLGFDYPPRARFFRSELEQAFLLAREENIDLLGLMGSYAGAMGPPQFIPSSYRAYAVDGDGDGRRDLLGNWDDILMSVANYFVKHGWRRGEPVVARGQIDDAQSFPVGQTRLKLDDTVASLSARGIRFETELDADAPTLLIGLEGADGDEHWVGFKNFYVITRYNRSAMYAMAVYQLATELAAATSAAATVAETD